MNWQGVIPAITTPFRPDLEVDYSFLTRHAQWLIENGCVGIVALGSLGEGATLSFFEKVRILETLVKALPGVPIAAGISSLSTQEAVELAREAERVGCQGLMVLPPYVYSTDWREMKAHVAAIMNATDLSCMLYNNPIAYRTDFLVEHIEELLNEHPNLHAVKESSADVRRVTSIRAVCGDRIQILVGVDDAIVEGIAAGARGWIAGTVNALPRESVQLFELALAGKHGKAFEIYSWFLPLLKLDVVPKFVQLIKLAQQEAGAGSERVRGPRLVLEGAEREAALHLIHRDLSNRPAAVQHSTPLLEK
ncbi:4-hydroxy-tetrahydrodipicolinate synthase [Abditibacteriota bacterium]|nr:4-hydroxy-tetrahydrodipicolinate synthase [Abditibacteriota bacterium]